MATQTRAEGVAERAVEARSPGEPSSRGRFDPLLGSKLRPPQPLKQSVFRTELVELLRDSREQRLVVVSAAPGYGKSTLLAQWASRSRRPFGWVSLDGHDNDPVVLLSYIAAALDQIEPLPERVFDVLGSAGASIEGRIVPTLASALASINSSFALVLDDMQEIKDRQCLDAIEVLIDHLPGESQLVLAGQIQPSRRAGALRAHGQLLELGPSDLRMDEAEARELFAGAGVELPDDQLAELTKRTEGWPGGLYLAALSLSEGRGSVASFRGDDRLVADYLREELLARLPDEQLRFLTRTSVLDEMGGPLCDFVLGAKDSARSLESLERSNLFVIPLDSNREWYRYHRLFRDLLRAELNRTEPDEASDLIGLASDWCSANGRVAGAVGYAQAAEDIPRVAELVERHGQAEYQLGHAVTVEAWLSWLEQRNALERVPRAAVIGAWFKAIRGDAADAERWADAAERAESEQANRNGGPLIEQVLAVFRAARCRRGVEAMRADAELSEQSFPRGSTWWATAALFLAISEMLRGNTGPADDLFADIAESAPATEAWNALSIALAERGILAAGADDWVEAARFFDQAEAVVRRSVMEEYPPNALVYALGARVAAHRHEGARANELLARAQRLRPQLTHALLAYSIQIRLELARAYVALADPAGARTLLREADGLMRRGMGFGSLDEDAREIRESLETARAEAPGASTLTSAELRLLPFLPTHLSFREIGDRLYLSRHTVKSHAMSIYRKLDVTSRTESVERAKALGLLED